MKAGSPPWPSPGPPALLAPVDLEYGALGQTVKQSRLCLMSQGSPALGLLGELSGGGVLGEGLKAMQRLRFLIHLGLGRLHLRIPFSAASEPG